jgi:hypothetical protein
MTAPLIGQDSPVSLLPQIVPPFTGTEVLYVIDDNGVSSKVLLSDLAGIGIRAMKNSDIVNFPAFAILASNGVPGQLVVADDSTLGLAQAVAVCLAGIAVGQLGTVQFNGYCRGFVGLTVGPLWLGTAGGISNAPPAAGSGKYATRLGVAISTTEAILEFGYPNGPM